MADDTGNGQNSLMVTEGINDSHRLVKCLDELERRVEDLRDRSSAIERDKELLLASLQNIQDNPALGDLPEDEREEIAANAERLICRCLTVEINVSTPRDEHQEKALVKVRRYLSELEGNLQKDPDQARQTAKSYFNSCLSEPTSGQIDHRFQNVLLECTADDQKAVRRKLESLMTMLEDTDSESVDDSSDQLPDS